MKYSEEEILQILKQDRENGAVLLLEQYAGLLWSVCHRRLENAEDIRECVNATFADVCMHPEKYDKQKGSFKNYLCQIADRKAIDRYHENCRRLQAEEEIAQRSQRNQENAAHENTLVEHLEEALEHLEPIDSQILRMKYYDGMSYQEIAEKLSLTEGTVKMRSMRSRRKLGKILLLLLILAMLAACAVAALRQYRFHQRYGISWDGEDVVYEMVGDGITWEQDQIRYELIDAVYQKIEEGVPSREYFQLLLYVRVFWQGGEQEGWSLEFPEAVQEELGVVRVTQERINLDRYNKLLSDWRYVPQTESQMDTYTDIEVAIECELEIRGQDPVPIGIYTDSGLVGEITVEPTPLAEYEEPKTSYELLDDVRWKVGPAMAGEEFSIISLSQQEMDSWRISRFLFTSPGGRAGRDEQQLVLEAADGTTYSMMRSTYSFHEVTEDWRQHQYEIYFREVPAGEYMLHIPHFFLRRDWNSEAFTLALPQVSDQKMDCDVTALFPDGSGFHITGITRTEEEIVTMDWREATQELLEVRRLFWRYTLEMESISVGELEMYLCLLGYEGEAAVRPKQENGVLSFQILQEEAPESITMWLTEPDYVLDRSYTVPVTIQPSIKETESAQ